MKKNNGFRLFIPKKYRTRELEECLTPIYLDLYKVYDDIIYVKSELVKKEELINDRIASKDILEEQIDDINNYPDSIKGIYLNGVVRTIVMNLFVITILYLLRIGGGSYLFGTALTTIFSFFVTVNQVRVFNEITGTYRELKEKIRALHDDIKKLSEDKTKLLIASKELEIKENILKQYLSKYLDSYINGDFTEFIAQYKTNKEDFINSYSESCGIDIKDLDSINFGVKLTYRNHNKK